MQAVRLSVGLLSALSLPLAACGGDDGGGVVVPDAKVFMDAPPDSAPTCSIENQTISLTPTSDTGAVLDLPASQTQPARLSFRTVFGPSEAEADWLEFTHNKPVTLNTDINLMNGCTQNAGFCMILLGNITIANNMLDSEQIFVARSGTINVTEAANAGQGSFKATITNAMFKRYESTGSGLVDAMDTMCMASIPTMTIDMPVTAPMQIVAGSKLPVYHVATKQLRIAE